MARALASAKRTQLPAAASLGKPAEGHAAWPDVRGTTQRRRQVRFVGHWPWIALTRGAGYRQGLQGGFRHCGNCHESSQAAPRLAFDFPSGHTGCVFGVPEPRREEAFGVL